MTSIAVVIPVWNRAAIIGRAIDSVLAQDYRGGSVTPIVVDDGSTDNLVEALRGYGERVRYLRQDRNAGAAAARNAGVTAATADFIAFLDSDDIWLPNKLNAQIGAMVANGWNASCTGYVLARRGRPGIVLPRYSTVTIGLDELVWGCFVSPGSTLVVRRTVFQQIGMMDANLSRLEDWDWLLRYVANNRLGFLAEPLALIEPSQGGGIAKVAPALDILQRRYGDAFVGRYRRYFAAAIEIERAAACYRAGKRARALASAFTSLLYSPLRNDALLAVVHNRLAAR